MSIITVALLRVKNRVSDRDSPRRKTLFCEPPCSSLIKGLQLFLGVKTAGLVAY